MWIQQNIPGAYFFDVDYIKDRPEIFERSILFDIATGIPNKKYKHVSNDVYQLIGNEDDSSSLLPCIFAWYRHTPIPLVNVHFPDDISELRKVRDSLVFYGFKIPAECADKKINSIIKDNILKGIMVGLFVYISLMTLEYFNGASLLNFLSIS